MVYLNKKYLRQHLLHKEIQDGLTVATSVYKYSQRATNVLYMRGLIPIDLFRIPNIV